MNSQFKNSNLGFYLYAFIIVIIAFASIFVVWYMVKGYSLGTYEEGTIIGSVYIGGLKEEEVENNVNERISRWLNDESIVFELTYQEYSYEFNRALFYFDFELSMFKLVDGETNKLYATYQNTERQDIVNDIQALDFLAGINDEFDYESLINDILDDAGFMKSYSSMSLENYLLDVDASNSVIGTLTLDVFDGIDVNSLISGINDTYELGHIIADDKELFDIVEKLSENLIDSELSILSTAMLALILETNFAINEIHYIADIDYINYDMDTFPYFGHNANVNQVINNSFSFYNPNNSDYYFTVEKVNDSSIIISLIGLAFVDDITATPEKTVLEHIIQYTDNDEILQTGYDGAIIEVVRTITDIEGNTRYNNVIMFEFYPPTKQITLNP